MSAEFSIVEGGLDDPRVVALLSAHLELMHSQSPPESTHALNLDGLRGPGISFWHVQIAGGPVACGALKLLSARHGEIKSMHTASRARGKGIARALLKHIENVAKANGVAQLSLETGSPVGFEPARKLYAGEGYETCGPFSDYVEDPYSTFMTKALI